MIERILSRLKIRKSIRKRRVNLAAVERLGFKGVLVSALGQDHRYQLVGPDGMIYDNGGHGFSSSRALLEAAEKLSQNPVEEG